MFIAQLVTLGETMAAFAPDRMGPLRYVSNYGIRIAGAESNTAIGAAKLGVQAAWVSRLGADEFGQYIRNQIRAEGVDCTGVTFDPAHRTGVMFKQTGSGETSVFYYRENSAASHMAPQDLDETVFRDCRILHLSGITPVLSDSCAETVQAAIRLAKSCGAKLSFDPNIRKKAVERPGLRAHAPAAGNGRRDRADGSGRSRDPVRHPGRARPVRRAVHHRLRRGDRPQRRWKRCVDR